MEVRWRCGLGLCCAAGGDDGWWSDVVVMAAGADLMGVMARSAVIERAVRWLWQFGAVAVGVAVDGGAGWSGRRWVVMSGRGLEGRCGLGGDREDGGSDGGGVVAGGGDDRAGLWSAVVAMDDGDGDDGERETSRR
ncbi:hypothetical protein F0562_011034 [Nyssa sinensis]|uniref:Uncharacterized protein n=1 Tax=Nyssa sinensis TaxID=561372 RepID=A0A5J5A5B5_9ASTE|nr:hypothetical protein F0562_011034 [Nyssa sinensis]